MQTMVELRALSPGVAACVTLLGYHAPGDGGGGSFYWDSAATEADNGGTMIVPNAKPAAGRWKRLVEGPLSVKWFGAVGKGDLQMVSDGAITTGTAKLTSATAKFTADDVGKTITVQGAGDKGAVLKTTITTFLNSTEVMLQTVASTTVPSKEISTPRVTWGTDDTLAIQRAVDAGTHIVFPSGTYACKNVSLPSSRTIEGLGQVTLMHLDGLSTLSDIFSSRVVGTKGSIERGSSVLEVESAFGFEVGAVCTILGAVGGFATQATELTNDRGMTLEVVSTKGFPLVGTLVIGAEFVEYNGKDDTSFTVTKRGALGSTASAHAAGTATQFAKSMVTTITGISGTRIILDDAATFTVSSALVAVGAVRLALRNLHFNGNKRTGPSQNCVCVKLAQARFFRIEQCVFQNGDHGGILVQISQDGWITDNQLSDNGQPTNLTGANLWLFTNCRNIHVTRNIIGGGSQIGIAIDDRTTQALPWQGPCEDNHIESNSIAGKGAKNLHNGIVVVGSSRNLVANNHILDCEIGIAIAQDQGHPVSEVSRDNIVCFNVLNGCSTDISATGVANLICNNM